MGLRLDAEAVRFSAADGSLLIDAAEIGALIAIGGWTDGLPVRILVDGAWEDADADPDLPIFHRAGALATDHPVRAFVDTLPAEVRASLPLFHEHQVTLLRLLRHGAPAVELTTSAPNLVWLMLPAIARRSAREVADLLRRRRTDLLSFAIGQRATPEMLRFVARYEPQARVPHERGVLVRALRRPALVHAFRHGAGVTMARLRAAAGVSPWLRLRGVRDVVVLGDRPTDAYEAPMLARDALRIADDLGIWDAEAAIGRARTLEDLRGLHDRWAARARRRFQAQLAAGTATATVFENVAFPPAPVPGTETIIHVATLSELLAEGAAMHHCVGSYARACIAGRAFIYKVLAPERATLELGVRDGVVVVKQVKLACNGAPGAATIEAVRAWLRAAACGVAARGPDADAPEPHAARRLP